MQASLQIKVVVKTDFSLGFMRQSLKTENDVGRVMFSRCSNDFGFCAEDGSIEVNRERTANSLEREYEAGTNSCNEKKASCRKQGTRLIISDIAPQPFLVADGLGIPGIAITNFICEGLYRHLLGATHTIFAP